jgi:hypothetical protein
VDASLSGRKIAVVVAIIAVVVGLAVVAICCFEPRPSKEKAEELIVRSPFMEEARTEKIVLYESQILPIGSLLREHPEVQPFVDAGFVSAMSGVLFGAKFVLTQKGKAASLNWKNMTGPGGEEAWEVTTARRRLVSVSEPLARHNAAECEFSWDWEPTKEGKDLGLSSSPSRAKAFLTYDQGNWMLADIRL